MFIGDNLEGVGSICMTFAPFSYHPLTKSVKPLDNYLAGVT